MSPRDRSDRAHGLAVRSKQGVHRVAGGVAEQRERSARHQHLFEHGAHEQITVVSERALGERADARGVVSVQQSLGCGELEHDLVER